MSTDQQSISRLQATAIDGRAEGVRYRQSQLYALHKRLGMAAPALLSALESDGSTAQEASAELVMAQDTVRNAYRSLDFAKEMKEEYSIAKGQDYSLRRTAVGVIVIRPGTIHTRLYSVLSALAPAVASGNCVAVEVRWSFH